jgi:hypothetical protein
MNPSHQRDFMRLFMNEKRITFLASEEVLRIIAKRQQDTGASISEILRRAVRKLDEPAPIEMRTTQPALLLSRRENA